MTWEKHYRVSEVAEILALSDDMVRIIFLKEPGVLDFACAHEGRAGKGRSRGVKKLIRIPESVVRRVYERRIKKQ